MQMQAHEGARRACLSVCCIHLMPEVQAGAVMVDMTWPNSLSSFRLSTLSLAAFLSFSWSPVLPTGSPGPA